MESSLRDRLVMAGVDLLAQEGIEALSLREIARRAEVSHGAPRRYFPTHLSLLAAIASEGYRQLGHQIAQLIATGSKDPRQQLHALGRLYLEFARSNRGMFELMFRHDLLRGNQLGLREASRPLFGVLVDLLSRARPASATKPALAAGALWANLHGIAQLWQWGSLQMTVPIDEVEPLLAAVLQAHVGP